MTDLLRRDTDDESAELQAYDWQYYDTLLRKTEYGVDPNEVAQYFELSQVLDGMFEITGEVFGLTYEHVEAPTWHPEVITYAIHDAASGDLISHFYMDLFPREAKFSHAAAFPLVPGRKLDDGNYQHPVSAIVANVTKPTEERPSLLQHQEVETMFHEFGHLMHHIFKGQRSRRRRRSWSTGPGSRTSSNASPATTTPASPSPRISSTVWLPPRT